MNVWRVKDNMIKLKTLLENENKVMTKEQRQNLELVKSGFANVISTQLATKQAMFGPDARLSDIEKQEIPM